MHLEALAALVRVGGGLVLALAAASSPRSSPLPGRRSRHPEPGVRPSTTRAGVFRRRRSPRPRQTIDGDRGIGPAPRSSSTPSSSRTAATTEEADCDARALMDQWGVGRKGFDDGLVILFDMYPGLDHGQVILYGGAGLPRDVPRQRREAADLRRRHAAAARGGDFDGALLVALQRVDAAATPEHAATPRARPPGRRGRRPRRSRRSLSSCSSAAPAWSWRRYGRDPVYLDDPSVHMAGPPRGPDAGRRRLRPCRRPRRGGR